MKKVYEFNDKYGSFVLVDVESLSIDDEFMKYIPRDEQEMLVKSSIVDAINSQVKNFYRPEFNWSRADTVPRRYTDWCEYPQFSVWSKAAQSYDTSRNSRLGNYAEYCAYLGVLIKQLIKEGMTVDWAWNAICSDRKKLEEYYYTHKSAKDISESINFVRIVGYDLKFVGLALADDSTNQRFWQAGGSVCPTFGFTKGAEVILNQQRPLGTLCAYGNRCSSSERGIGWLIIPKWSD